MKQQSSGRTLPLTKVFGPSRAKEELKRLKQENARYRSMVDHTPLGYFTVDQACQIIDSNAAGANLLARPVDKITSTSLANYIQFEDQAGLKSQVIDVASGQKISFRTVVEVNGDLMPVMLYLSPIDSSFCTENLCQITMLDLSEHQAAKDSLKIARDGLYHVAQHDCLTRLLNRAGFINRLEQAIVTAEANGSQLALLLLDLDRFKRINDPLGHQIGDQLLKEVATRLQNIADQSDVIGRLGGDEFAILLQNVDSTDQVADTASKIAGGLAKPCHPRSHEICLAASIGVSVYPTHSKRSDELMSFADAAMNQAKSLGRNRVQFFSSSLSNAVRERFQLENDLRAALADNQFELYFQPQYDLARMVIIGYEALLRWNHPQLGLLAPDVFINIAEDSDFIEPLGDWVLTEACKRFKELTRAGSPAQRISVNVSARQFTRQLLNSNSKFCERISAILRNAELPARALEIELTESALLDDTSHCVESLQQLRNMGIDIAIDDFGTGYSSFSRLQQLPVSRVKIDKSFVCGTPHDHNNKSIVQAIISVAHDLGMEVVAEGVETHQQALFLSEAGCNLLQGYYVGRPMPITEVATVAQLKTVAEPTKTCDAAPA